MSMDVLILGNTVTTDYERGQGDVTPTPKNGSIICEEHWHCMIGEPSEEETFKQREAAFIASMGWIKRDS